MQLMQDYGSDQLRDQIMKNFGYTALISVLDKEEELISPALQLINSICESSAQHQEMMCLFGIVPYLLQFG